MRETWVWSLGQEDPREKELATHSSILVWRYHGRRSLVGYSPRGRRVGHLSDWLHFHFQGKTGLPCTAVQTASLQPEACIWWVLPPSVIVRNLHGSTWWVWSSPPTGEIWKTVVMLTVKQEMVNILKSSPFICLSSQILKCCDRGQVPLSSQHGLCTYVKEGQCGKWELVQ